MSIGADHKGASALKSVFQMLTKHQGRILTLQLCQNVCLHVGVLTDLSTRCKEERKYADFF